jgi:hypothetical protein
VVRVRLVAALAVGHPLDRPGEGMAVLFRRQDMGEQRRLELIALVYIRAGAQLPDQLHQGVLGSPVPWVVQHLLE